MNFHIGQKVVCVNDAPSDERPVLVQRGHVYTVARIGTWCGQAWIDVHEVSDLAGYFSHRFRPVVERKTETGMAILREILDRESHQDKPPVKRTVHS